MKPSTVLKAMLVIVSLLVALRLTGGLGASAADQAPPTATTRTSDYLTHGAGQCEDCHGVNFIGAPMPGSGPNRATFAPSLHGLTMFAKDSEAITFLQTAKLPDGSNAKAPMPHYNFNLADATAIVAYLRSLN